MYAVIMAKHLNLLCTVLHHSQHISLRVFTIILIGEKYPVIQDSQEVEYSTEELECPNSHHPSEIISVYVYVCGYRPEDHPSIHAIHLRDVPTVP